jgi:hypothetical protein
MDPGALAHGLLDLAAASELPLASQLAGLASGAWSAWEGDWTGAGLSLAGMVPGMVWADAAKLGKRLGSAEGVGELLGGGGRAIAGAGTNEVLRDAGRLASQYGGSASDWANITSTASNHIQTHGYRNVATGEVVELKSIIR